MSSLKIIMVLITISIFSGCTTRVKVHVPYEPGEQCIFEKLTDEEKASMSEAVKRKLGRNYKGCFIRLEAEKARIKVHNALHES